ncbi:MAG TPA: DHA2 family efflux MFS transporter permease subunit [Stellaceae bacterium]|nr:DHA2 family efflux MFS transporter permease subunit [Stellaceae bacterium]
MSESPPNYRATTDPKLRLLIPMVIAVAFFMEQLDSTIITTSIPEMARSLDENPLRLNLAITSYLLSLAVFIPISGWIADRFGTRTMFCAAIGIFTVGSALCGVATSLPMLVATRVLQGFGGAMMTPVGRLILFRSFPKEGLITAMTYMTIPALIGPTLGPVIGGLLTTYASWRWIFYVNIPIGAIGMALALRFIDQVREPSPSRFDFIGFGILGTGLALLQFAIESLVRPVGDTGAGAIIGEGALFATAFAILLVYRWHARRCLSPALDLSLFQIRSFRIGVGAGGVCRIGLNAVPFLLPLLFQLGFGLSPLRSGLLTFMMSVGALVMRTMASRLLRTFGFRRLLIGNAVIGALAIAGLALVGADTPHWVVVIYVLVFGVIRSTQFIGINALSYAEIPARRMSAATSLGGVAQQLSMGFGIAISAALLGMVTGPGGSVTLAGFDIVFVLVALVTLASTTGFVRLGARDGAEVSGHGAGR